MPLRKLKDHEHRCPANPQNASRRNRVSKTASNGLASGPSHHESMESSESEDHISPDRCGDQPCPLLAQVTSAVTNNIKWVNDVDTEKLPNFRHVEHRLLPNGRGGTGTLAALIAALPAVRASICDPATSAAISLHAWAPLVVYRTAGGRKGWGVRAGSDIAEGTLLCEYSGELISADEARRRLSAADAANAGTYVLAVREVFASSCAAEVVLRTIVDASTCGSIARFVNHACPPPTAAAAAMDSDGSGGPNAEVRVVRVDSGVGHLCLFATCPIPAGTEVTFSYCDPSPSPCPAAAFGSSRRGAGGGDALESEAWSAASGTRCLCGARWCRGWLPAVQI